MTKLRKFRALREVKVIKAIIEVRKRSHFKRVMGVCSIWVFKEV